MSLRDLIARLTAGGEATVAAALPSHIEALVPELIDLVAEEVEPNLVYLPRFRKRIEPSIRRTIAYLREAGALLPERAVDLAASAWSAAIEINTLFATPADVGTTLGRSADVRRWFAEHPDSGEAYAWLGAERHERTILGMALVGDTVQRDVIQRSVSFDQQRIVLPAVSVTAARVELGLALFRGLLAIVLERIEASRARSKNLAERQAMLKVRTRRLKQQQGSLGQLAGDLAMLSTEIAAAERELAEAGDELKTSKARFTTLDDYLGEAQRVLAEPGEWLRLVAVPVRMDRMGIQVGSGYSGPVNELCLIEIQSRDFRRVAVLVRCLRADLPPAPDPWARYG